MEPRFDMPDWETQLRKGLIELVVMGSLRGREAYGYQLLEELNRLPGLELSESTVYPVLARLAREKLLSLRSAPSPAGPPRRYYRLTAEGSRRLGEMATLWKAVTNSVANVVEGGTS